MPKLPHSLRERDNPIHPVPRWRFLGSTATAQENLVKLATFAGANDASTVMKLLEANQSESFGWRGSTAQSLPGLVSFLEDFMTADERHRFLTRTLPKICRLACMNTHGNPIPLPVLREDYTGGVNMTRREIACVIAGAFLGDIARECDGSDLDEKAAKSTERPPMTGSMLDTYQRKTPTLHQFQKFMCIASYLEQVCEILDQPALIRKASTDGQTENEFYPELEGESIVTFYRRSVLTPAVSFEMLSSSRHNNISLANLFLQSGPITSAPNSLKLQTVFSSYYIGEGFYSTGCGQEEMMFSVYPEALMLHYIMEPLADHESALVIGAQKFNEVEGFGADMKFKRPSNILEDPIPFDLYGRRANALVCMDPLEAFDIAQYGMETIARETFKSYAGFSTHPVTLGENYTGIATGNWGGGAACGDPQLRLLMQWLAATYAGRPLYYHTVFETEREREAMKLISEISELASNSNLTVKDLFGTIVHFSEHDGNDEGIFGDLLNRFARRVDQNESGSGDIDVFD